MAVFSPSCAKLHLSATLNTPCALSAASPHRCCCCCCCCCCWLQDVATTMQQLVAALTQQQRMPRCKVALDLLLNFSTPVQAVQPGSTAPAPGTAGSCCTLASSSTAQQKPVSAQAEALVQQLLRLVLTPKELSSESLMLPLLEAVAMAASSGWSSAKSSSSSSRQWGSAAQGSTVAAAAAALLAACTPSGRCLEVLLRTCQVSTACPLAVGSSRVLCCVGLRVLGSHTRVATSGTGCSSCQGLCVSDQCVGCVGCLAQDASRLCGCDLAGVTPVAAAHRPTSTAWRCTATAAWCHTWPHSCAAMAAAAVAAMPLAKPSSQQQPRRLRVVLAAGQQSVVSMQPCKGSCCSSCRA
jgi:hypothetical protein